MLRIEAMAAELVSNSTSSRLSQDRSPVGVSEVTVIKVMSTSEIMSLVHSQFLSQVLAEVITKSVRSCLSHRVHVQVAEVISESEITSQ